MMDSMLNMAVYAGPRVSTTDEMKARIGAACSCARRKEAKSNARLACRG